MPFSSTSLFPQKLWPIGSPRCSLKIPAARSRRGRQLEVN
jgi:hypothetical protein